MTTPAVQGPGTGAPPEPRPDLPPDVAPARPLDGAQPRLGLPRLGLRGAALLVALVTLAVGLAGLGVRATHGGQASVDEPQYLLSALSLAEDADLDLTDELRDRRWRAFSDVPLPVQTQVQPDGSRLSPHDPLLPVLLAVPMGLGGFLAAKAALVLLAAVTAALTLWVAVRRFRVPVGLATAGVALAFASPPLAVYAHQVYPEIPAALAVVGAVAALTGRLGRGGPVALGVAVVALPWLGVKFAPVAAVLAVVGLVRLVRARRVRGASALAGGLALAGIVYLAVHQAVWGGWTVYASGDHFTSTGEFSVVGVEPDYLGRSLRLVGLLVDRGFGIAAWQPAWLLVVPALAVLLRRRVTGVGVLGLPVLAGWLVATYVALTMHGFWWPGRQVVVVLPVALLLVLVCLARLDASGAPWARRLRVFAGALAVAGVVTMLALLVDGWAREITWVVGFENVDDPLYAARRVLLPDYRGDGLGLWARHVAWTIGVLACAALAWRSTATSREPPPDRPLPVPTPEPLTSPDRRKGTP
ncbi:MAG: hypothetical protein ACRDYU_15400 [Actinomycetes bacterium]